MKNSIIKSGNIQSKKLKHSSFEMFHTTKRENWNNKRRYSFLTQYKFI